MPQAVQFAQHGGTDVLQVLDLAAPTVGPGQLRLRVRAAGVNPIDWKMLQGLMTEEIPLRLPAGLGSDVAGVVDQVGEGVTDLAVGDAVLGRSVTPSFAEYALAAPADLIGKPEDLDWAVAGTLAGAGGTAYTALRRLDLQPGQTLLIHAAAGGVGTFAVQLAVARGVRVIGTASEPNHGYLRSIGALPVTYGDGLAERVRSVAPDGVDGVLDASGRGEIPLSIELTGDPQRVLTLVAFDAVDTGIKVHIGGPGIDLGPALRELVGLFEQRRLTVAISRTFPLARAAAALDASATGHLNGKIVLLPGTTP
jgi:NADPH:quinone reductase-like Zn-dependent oxidoreductase